MADFIDPIYNDKYPIDFYHNNDNKFLRIIKIFLLLFR